MCGLFGSDVLHHDPGTTIDDAVNSRALVHLEYRYPDAKERAELFRIQNAIDDIAGRLLTQYSATDMRVSRIRWNAQEDLTAVDLIRVGRTISLVYKGTTTTYRVVGIDGAITDERYMIDYYLAKV